MKQQRKGLFFLLALLLTLHLQSCGSSTRKVGKYKLHSSITGLKLDKSQMPVLVYKRPGAPVLASYDSFIIDPIELSYKDKNIRKLNSEDVKEIQKYFHDVLTSELRENGYEVVTRRNKNTMRISFVLSGIKAPSAAPNIVGILAPIAISVGEVTIEAIFKNILKNRIDALVVSRSSGSHVFNKTPWSTWSDIKSTMDQWAEGIAESIGRAKKK